MKNKINVIYIFLIASLLSLFVLCIIILNNENEKTINLNVELKKLNTQKIDLKKIELKEKIKKFINEEFSLEIENFDDNIIYGSSLDSELITTGLWNFNLDNNSLNYYYYNYNNRILSYFIEDEIIYYITIEKNNDNLLFKWKLIKSKLDFSDQNVLDEGIIFNDSDTPFFRKDYVSKKIILYTIKDNIKYDNDFKLTTYKSEYKINIFENNSFKTIIKGKGDHINKSGNFSYNTFTNLNFYNYNIIYCNVSYYDKESIKLFNLTDNSEKILYENKNLNNWSLSITRCNKNNCILSFDNKNDTEKNKIVNLNLDNNNINIINSKGRKRPELLKNDEFIIFTNDYFTIFNVNENNFIKKFDLITKTFINFKTNNNDKLIIEDRNSEFYIINLN